MIMAPKAHAAAPAPATTPVAAPARPPQETTTIAETSTTAPDQGAAERAATADAELAAAFGIEPPAADNAAADKPAERDAATSTAEEPATEQAGDEPAREEQPWTLKQAQRYRRQAQRALAEAKERAEELAALRVALDRREQDYAGREARIRDVEELLARDPQAALAELARRSGRTVADVHDALLVERANQPAESAAERRLAALEARLAERDKEAAAEREQAHAAAQGASLDREARRVLAIREQADLAERWPHAASLPEAELYAQTLVRLRSALARSPSVSLDAIADEIDREARAAYDSFTSSRWLGSGQSTQAAPAAKLDGQGSPAQGAKPGRMKATIGNDGSAEASGAREKSQRQREAEADRLLRAAFGVGD
jgi:hypothetical protein